MNAKTCESRSRGPDRLARLQILVRHGAERRQADLHREADVARADELRTQTGGKRAQHLVVPHTREAPARPVVGDAELGVGDGIHPLDLFAEPPPTLGELRPRMDVAVVYLGDDREHRNLEHDRMEPGTADRDVDLAVGAFDRLDPDEALVELEEAQKIDEIALEEPPPAEIRQLVRRETQAAKPANLVANLADVRRAGRRRGCGT